MRQLQELLRSMFGKEQTRAVRESRPLPSVRLKTQECQRQRPLPALWRWLIPCRWTEPQLEAVERRRERLTSTQSLSERRVLQNPEICEKKWRSSGRWWFRC